VYSGQVLKYITPLFWRSPCNYKSALVGWVNIRNAFHDSIAMKVFDVIQDEINLNDMVYKENF